MQHPIPVSASAAGPVPPPVDNLIADIFWVTAAGQVAQELTSVPVQDGIALYDGPPLEPSFAWAVRIRRDGTPGALFRSGPLPQLPGPPSPELSGGIAFLVTPINFSLTTRGSDGVPEIVEQQLRDLPAPLEFSSVQLTSDQAGHYVVTLHGRLRFGRRLGLPFLAPSFSYRRAFGLVGSLGPGRPVPPVLAQPTRPPAIGSWVVLPYVAVLDRLMQAAVERQLDAALRWIAWIQTQSDAPGFGPQTISAGDVQLSTDPVSGTDASLRLSWGAVTGMAAPP
jgi:hypothetical protein